MRVTLVYNQIHENYIIVNKTCSTEVDALLVATLKY